MAAGPRRKLETFTMYRTRLRDESARLKFYLKGRVIWLSAMVYNAGTPTAPELKKQIVQGTYRKPQ